MPLPWTHNTNGFPFYTKGLQEMWSVTYISCKQ